MKRSRLFTKHINESLKVGDEIYLHDGSALSYKLDDEMRYLYIVDAHPELTGDSRILKHIEGTIEELNIDNQVCVDSVVSGYLQDCIIRLGTGLFRTCSAFVHKVNDPKWND